MYVLQQIRLETFLSLDFDFDVFYIYAIKRENRNATNGRNGGNTNNTNNIISA